MYKHLTEEELIRIANIFQEDNWKVIQSKFKWKGHDIVGDSYIFQLSYMGSIHIYTNNIKEINIPVEREDKIRKELQQIMSSYE